MFGSLYVLYYVSTRVYYVKVRAPVRHVRAAPSHGWHSQGGERHESRDVQPAPPSPNSHARGAIISSCGGFLELYHLRLPTNAH